MSRINAERDDIDKTIEIARQNKKLLPQVRNWCGNINIDDHSAGMIAEYYQLPTMLYISCSYTEFSLAGMDFKSVAEHFISKSCIDCPHHKPLTSKNFGTELIAAFKREGERAIQDQADRKKKFDEVKKDIDGLANQEKSIGQITTLSILKLVQQLDEASKDSTIDLLVEASKLSPSYFSNAAIDYITLHACEEPNEKLNAVLLNISEANRNLPEFSCKRIREAVVSTSSDLLFGVFFNTVSDPNSVEDTEIISKIPELFRYERQIGEPYNARKYPNAVRAFIRLREDDPAKFERIIRSKLILKEKSQRINICSFLEALMEEIPAICLPFLPELIQSYSFDEDRFGESADGKTSQVIEKLFQSYPMDVMKSFKIFYSTCSDGGKIAMFNLFSKIIVDTTYGGGTVDDFLTDTLIQEYFHARNESVKKAALKSIRYTSGDAAKAFGSKLHTFIGQFIDVCRLRQRHDLQVKEIENLGSRATTFNPLLNKSPMDIWGIKVDLDSAINDLDSIATFVGMEYQQQSVDTLIPTIESLDSSIDGFVKSRLIGLLKNIIQDRIILSRVLPNIHTWLFDTRSQLVRIEAVRFLENLLEKHSSIVTKTILDLIKIFLKDPEIGVCRAALKAYSGIIKNYPDLVDEADITQILSLCESSYVILHKSALELSYDIYPFITDNQRQHLVLVMLGWEETYFKEKDFSYCKELWRKLIFVSRENKSLYQVVTQSVIPRYCDVDDYYTSHDAIEALMELRQEDKTISKIWFIKALGFLQKFHDDEMMNNPEFSFRNRIIKEFYSLPRNVIEESFSGIESCIKVSLGKRDYGTGIALLGVLSFYRLNEHVLECLAHFDRSQLEVKANEQIKLIVDMLSQMNSLEIRIVNK